MTEVGETLIDLQDPRAADLGVVGGKGWHLAQLQRYGLPVPDGLVLPAGWSGRWLVASGLRAQLDTAVVAAQAGNIQPLDDMAPLLAQSPIPTDLHDCIAHSLQARGWLDRPLAVRSSAIGEDAGQASFAGIYRSCLNVQGLAQVEAAVRAVWASLWTPTAVLYRQRLQGDSEAPAQMAVVIMPLVPAVASGIAFTCDPVTGRDDQLLIHAQWGLGESLVGGQAAGDEYRFVEDVDADRLTLIEQQVGSKLRKTTLQAAGGTRSVATTPGEAAALALSAAQAQELAELLRDAAHALDFANPIYDLEWVWDGQRFWLTQARPVTARPNHTYGALQAQPTWWSRGNTCEVVPHALSPIDWSLARRSVNLMLSQPFLTGGYALLQGVQRAALLHGRLYLNASVIQWELFESLGLAPAVTNDMMGGHQPTIEVPSTTWRHRLRWLRMMAVFAVRDKGRRKRGRAEISAIMAQSATALRQPQPATLAALHASWRTQLARVRGIVDIMFMQASSGGSANMLIEQLEKAFPGEGSALATAMLAGGEPSVTAQQGYDLMALARLAQQHPIVSPVLASDTQDGDWLAQLPVDDPFRTALGVFLARYGHRGVYETYLRTPRWHEDPSYLLQTLRHLASTDSDALRARQAASAQAAFERVRQRTSWLKAAFLRGLAKAAHQECNDREAARSAFTALSASARQTLLAMGRLLVESRTLAASEDIFELTVPEIDRAVSGQIAAASLKVRIARRKLQFQDWQAMTPPDVISEQGNATTAWDHTDAIERDGSHYRGVPTGTGKVRGPARLLRAPEEGQRLLPGDILVARSTDPGWTPLFLKAGGVVVETGGYLSHSAIVARELAIPTVVNLPGIFDDIGDGEMLEVDGTRGVVTRV